MANSSSHSRIKKLVSNVKSTAENRAYYSNQFRVVDIRKSGHLPDGALSKFDRVTLDEQLNESISFTGINQNGSSFQLDISIVNLYDNVQQPLVESNWRLAKVSFGLWNSETRCRYTYSAEQLIDYNLKRSQQAADNGDCKNVYKIGSLSVEILIPYSLSRILLSGNVQVSRHHEDKSPAEQTAESEVLPVRIAISTHCTSDKFDYKSRFNVAYTSKIIEQSLDSDSERTTHSALKGPNDKSVQDAANTIQSGNMLKAVEKKPSSEGLLDLLRENRIDVPMMFQLDLEHYAMGQLAELKVSEAMQMWGAKSKRVSPGRPEILYESQTTRESLLIWAQCGHVIQLSRPVNHLNLVYGYVHSNFDYSSYLYDAKLHKLQTTGDEVEYKQVPFDSVTSFADLNDEFEIRIVGFKVKEYKIRFGKQCDDSTGKQWRKVQVNDFDGFARWSQTAIDIELAQKEAQERLFALPIGQVINDNLDDNSSESLLTLASEHLLGGKGISLIQLAQLSATSLKGTDVNGAQISVPKGVVVTCVAYQLWLRSSPLILSSIRELDSTRRALAARTYYVNPLSRNRMDIGQRQTILREQCRKTSLVLNSCPLPVLLRRYLYKQLVDMFGDKCLADPSDQDDQNDDSIKTFAVRSSAVGEDSLETSAAGQMRTILDARGFNSICRSIVECWSSQFELEAVTYKSQNGLKFNMPMAVVVQELVNCQVAGVAATCDPLTGNRQRLEITANQGLGEAVVAGKQTDTIRVDLTKFIYKDNNRARKDLLSKQDWCEKIVGQQGEQCCLDDKQIISLGNLLLELRATSSIKDREVEWGITGYKRKEQSSSSSSSSSSSASTNDSAVFKIHLLQSRPLTHLARLSAREIDREHDQGLSSPLDLVSRANFSEVMPGAMCKSYSTYAIVISSPNEVKPYEKNHTRNYYAASLFVFQSQVSAMVLSYSDAIRRFLKQTDAERAESGMILNSMLGSTVESAELRQQRDKLRLEKVHPLASPTKGLAHFMLLDMGLLKVFTMDLKQCIKNTILQDDLPEISRLIEELETNKSSTSDNHRSTDDESHAKISYCVPLDELVDVTRRPALVELQHDVQMLFDRLCKRVAPLRKAWLHHGRATYLSLIMNAISLKLIKSQPANPDKLSSTEAFDDFSILVRGPDEQNAISERTESGNVSNFLENLLECLIEEDLLDKIKEIDAKTLYKLLNGDSDDENDMNDHRSIISPNNKCVKLFKDFMAKNGHRAYKEFDLASLTWADDPSHLMRSLLMRAKNYTSQNKQDKLERQKVADEEQKKRYESIVSDKITNNKFLLLNVMLPRARRAILTREQTKSLLIKSIDKYRRALRYMGAQLCLLGVLPSVDLVYHLSIDELQVVVQCASSGKNYDLLAKILYKTRRRQQRQRLYDNIATPEPTVEYRDFFKLINAHVGCETSDSGAQQQRQQVPDDANDATGTISVRGLVSCSGKTTGRAFVVSSIDQMDQVQPNDILITYSIDISWTVYFFAISGIVTEVGGIISHGAVVAREYGIPTLCLAVGACSKFKTGQMITLDANKGVCYLAADEEHGKT